MAHPDLDKMFNTLVQFAQEMLKKHGEFHPFGVRIDAGGVMACDQPYTGDEYPAGQDMIDFLTDVFKDAASKGELRGCGICYDARVVPPNNEKETDAICTRIEHCEAQPIQVVLPYSKKMLGRVRYGEVFAAAGNSRVFGNSEV